MTTAEAIIAFQFVMYIRTLKIKRLLTALAESQTKSSEECAWKGFALMAALRS